MSLVVALPSPQGGYFTRIDHKGLPGGEGGNIIPE